MQINRFHTPKIDYSVQRSREVDPIRLVLPKECIFLISEAHTSSNFVELIPLHRHVIIKSSPKNTSKLLTIHKFSQSFSLFITDKIDLPKLGGQGTIPKPDVLPESDGSTIAHMPLIPHLNSFSN